MKCPVANCNEAFAIKQQLSKHLLSGHAHSELPLSKRSKKNHDISSAATSSGTTSSVHIISQQHIPLTTTPGRKYILCCKHLQIIAILFLFC